MGSSSTEQEVPLADVQAAHPLLAYPKGALLGALSGVCSGILLMGAVLGVLLCWEKAQGGALLVEFCFSATLILLITLPLFTLVGSLVGSARIWHKRHP